VHCITDGRLLVDVRDSPPRTRAKKKATNADEEHDEHDEHDDSV
jgi:hypothetical protein